MDSTTLIHSPNTNPSSSSSKLPIKRKTPDPNPHSDPITAAAAPPFKFHRIWTEPDEIRFLQGLLDCSSQNLAFPRDLPIFYARFSDTMSQPYTKSQLSEKLRRLRKKLRVISARLSKGMDRSQLSLHDRALYDLSRRLWHPEFAATSPFSGARNVGFNHCNNAVDVGDGGGGGLDDGDGGAEPTISSLIGVKVDFSPTLSLARENYGNVNSDCGGDVNGYGGGGRGGFGEFCDKGDDDGEEVKLSEVNVEFEGEEAAEDDDDDDEDEFEEDGAGTGEAEVPNGDSRCGNEIGEVAAKVVINVFDECLKEARRVISGGSGGGIGSESLYARWQQQRIAELDALGSRLRLVLEHSLTKS